MGLFHNYGIKSNKLVDERIKSTPLTYCFICSIQFGGVEILFKWRISGQVL